MSNAHFQAPDARRIGLLLTLLTASCAHGNALEEPSPHKDAAAVDAHAIADSGADQASASDTGVAEPDVSTTVEVGAPDAAPSPDVVELPDTVGVPEVVSGSCPHAGFTGALATYDFSSMAGGEASVAAASGAVGVTAGAVTRGPGLVATSGSSSINASGWSTSATDDKSTYYTFKLTPQAGCALSLTGASFGARSSATGPASGDVGVDVDGFTSLASFTTGSTATVTLTASAAVGSPIEVRVFGFGASSSGGTMRLTNTLTVTGALR